MDNGYAGFARPLGVGVVTPPAVPASTVAASNTFPYPVTAHVSGGTVTVIAVNGTATGLTSGAIRIPKNGTITVTYTLAPSWVWVAD